MPRDYWEVQRHFGVARPANTPAAGSTRSFARQRRGTTPEKRAERLWERGRAPKPFVAKCDGKPACVTEESKPTTQMSPLLFDLTSLQREANARFGFSAKNTLSLAQALYEKHKVLTYPRTDSRALPEDYIATVKQTLEAVVGSRRNSRISRSRSRS